MAIAKEKLGFGFEVEISVQPKQNLGDPMHHFVRFAQVLNARNMPARANTSNVKYPPDYDAWWLTRDSSLSAIPNTLNMECVSPKLRVRDGWDQYIREFWHALNLLFIPRKNLTCGMHIHIAPWGKAFKLKQAKIIAFACCYYEPFIISCLPKERRDNRYCQRNTRTRGPMGALYSQKTSAAIAQIASDIKRKSSLQGIVKYVQGGIEPANRYVLWNFQGLLSRRSGTIEFRGGRHVRGQVRSRRWIAFVVVFALLALYEDLLHQHGSFKVPRNSKAENVQAFWRKVREFAKQNGMGGHLPLHFKNMSEKRSSRRRQQGR